MNRYKVTYDTVQDYDPEWSNWKRHVVLAENYEEGKAKFHSENPGNKIFSIDEIDINGKYL